MPNKTKRQSHTGPHDCGYTRSRSLKTTAGSVAVIFLVLLSLAPAGAVPAYAGAQSEAGSAAVEGTLRGADGKAVSGVTVTVRNIETGYVRNIVTDRNGHYNAQVMPVGTYMITAKADNDVATVEGIQLTVGSRKSVDLTMRPALSGEGPTVVSANPGNIEREEMSTSSSIGLRFIGDLPIRGRNFPEFVKLTPGVIQESDRFGLVVAGQRSINSNVSIDGTDFNDPLQGNQRGGNEPVFFFPQSAVREFQVVRSGVTAEVGRTNAGFVNVVTKSGTNSFHGQGFYFNRNKELTSADAFDQSLNNKQNLFGGDFGGPINEDRAFFFVSAEQNFLTVPRFVKFKPQPAGVVLPAELASLEGEYLGTNNPTAVFARSDVTISNRDSLSVFYTYSRLSGKNFNSELTLDQAGTFNYGREGTSHGLRLGFTSVFNPELLNEIRGQAATDDRSELPVLASPQIVIGGVGTVGGDSGRPRVFDAYRIQITDNLSIANGAHQWRLGFDFNRDKVLQQRIANVQGRYDFASLTDYANRKIDRYRQALPASSDTADFEYRGVQKELALYVQDKMSLGRSVSLTAGLRWEGQWNPQPVKPNPLFVETSRIPNDLEQWQPRLGLAWNVAGKGTTIVRVTAGIYDARTPANLFQRITTDNGPVQALIDSKVDKSVLGFLHFPDMLAAVPAGVKLAVPSIFGFAQDFRNPRSFQTSATVEREFGRDLIVSAGYIHNSTWNLQRRLDRNLFRPTIDAAGMPIFPKDRPNPAISRFTVNESSAHSRYDGLLLSASQRLAKRVQFQINYTLARTLDDDSNERNFSKEGALNPFDLTLERAYSKQDVRHNLSFTGLTELPGGFTFSAIVLTHSAFPYSAIIGADTQNDGNDFNDRAIIDGHVSGRNTFREPAFFNLDLRLLKSFGLGEGRKLELTGELFNVTASDNKFFGPDSVSEFGTPTNPNKTAGLPLFAPSSARFGGPRQLQLGLRFAF
jgi:hypothetical protein